MEIEQAIATIEDGNWWCYIEDYDGPEMDDLHECLGVAITALREKAERENPQPLTFEGLRERVGNPVWIQYESILKKHAGQWMILRGFGWYSKEKMIFTDADFSSNDYGKTWLAYDHEPRKEAR